MYIRLLLIIPLVSALFADQVVLKNGDVITGSIVKKAGGKLTLKSQFLGEISMPWSAVQSIQSDEPLHVEFPAGQSAFGKVMTTDGTLEVAAPSEIHLAPLADVSALRNPAEQRTWERLQNPGLLELWTGFFDIGLALARGNARTETTTANFNATRVTRKDKLALTFNRISGTARVNDVNSSIANAVRGGWSYNRDFTPRFFVSTFNDYEHDRFQKLDLRFVGGIGFGVNALKNARTTLSFTGSGDYARENFTEGLHRNSAEVNFGNDLVHKFTSATNVTESFRIFANLSDTGKYRANLDIGAVTAIKKWLGWHVTASDRYLSNPVLGRQRNDLLVSTGLRVSFAN